MTDASPGDSMFHPPAAAALPSGRFSGRGEFQQRLRDALAAAAGEGWQHLILCDANFEDWPLGERAVVESLHAWSRSGRRCTLIAHRWDEAIRRHARFVSWRSTWSHIIDARGCSSADPLELPSALWTPGWVLHRLDAERCNGFSGAEPERRVALSERLHEWLRKSSPAFPATTLGL